eukprot:4825504-Pleurochrysis_carterae.AAC.4
MHGMRDDVKRETAAWLSSVINSIRIWLPARRKLDAALRDYSERCAMNKACGYLRCVDMAACFKLALEQQQTYSRHVILKGTACAVDAQ